MKTGDPFGGGVWMQYSNTKEARIAVRALIKEEVKILSVKRASDLKGSTFFRAKLHGPDGEATLLFERIGNRLLYSADENQ